MVWMHEHQLVFRWCLYFTSVESGSHLNISDRFRVMAMFCVPMQPLVAVWLHHAQLQFYLA